MIRLLLPILLVVFNSIGLDLIAPEPGTDIREFYFPYEELNRTKVYQYSNQNDPADHRYLHLRSYQKNGMYYLVTSAYNRDFQLLEEVTKAITDRGSVIVEYYVFIRDDSGLTIRVPCFIDQREVMRWDLRQGDKLSWRVKYSIPGHPSCRRIMEKNREYLGISQPKLYLGTRLETCRFFDSFQQKDECEYQELNWRPSFFAWQNYYYARGIGLVEFQITDPQGNSIAHKLTQIMELKEWNTLRLQYND